MYPCAFALASSACIGDFSFGTGDTKTGGPSPGPTTLFDGSTRDGGDGGESGGAPPDSRVDTIAAGAFHTCAVMRYGGLRCWGRSDSGQLGGSSLGASVPGTESKFYFVAAGDEFTCSLKTSIGGPTAEAQAPLCVGKNVPFGSETTAFPTEQWLAASSHVCALSVNMFLSPDRKLDCFGVSTSGQLVKRAEDLCASPDECRVVSASTSDEATCVLYYTYQGGVAGDRRVRCWGHDMSQAPGGSTPDATPYEISFPASVVPGSVTSIYGGYGRTCVTADFRNDQGQLIERSAVYCWQPPLYGVSNPPVPVKVTGVFDALALALGRAHGCAVRSNRSVVCWGDGAKGQLGAPPGLSGGAEPPVRNVTSIVAGSDHTCAQTADEKVRCWGDDSYGQLGGSSTTRPIVF